MMIIYGINQVRSLKSSGSGSRGTSGRLNFSTSSPRGLGSK